jgi:hypothetical protein
LAAQNARVPYTPGAAQFEERSCAAREAAERPDAAQREPQQARLPKPSAALAVTTALPDAPAVR